MKKILVAGVGNILRADEGVGVYLSREIRRKNIPQVQTEEIGTESWRLFSLAKDFPIVVLLDAMEMSDVAGKVGIWRDCEICPPQPWSLHEVNFPGEVSLARRLYGKPREFYLFGVQPADTEFGLGLSQVLQKKFPKITGQLEQFIHILATGKKSLQSYENSFLLGSRCTRC